MSERIVIGAQGSERGRHAGGRSARRRDQIDLSDTGVVQMDDRRRKKRKEPKLPKKEKKETRRKRRRDTLKSMAVEARVATAVFAELLHKGEDSTATLTSEKGRPLTRRRKREAAIEFTRGALDAYDVATIDPNTESVLDRHQLEKALKRIAANGSDVVELLARLGNLDGLAQQVEDISHQSELWSEREMKQIVRSARQYYRRLSNAERKAFDEHSHIPSPFQEWMLTSGLTTLSIGLGDGLAFLSGAAALGYYKAHEYPDIAKAATAAALAYTLWVGAIVGLSSKANADLIEKKGFSTDLVAKAMYDVGEVQGYGKTEKKKRARKGFILTEMVIKELPWIIGIPTLSALVELAFPQGGAEVLSPQDIITNLTSGNVEGNDLIKASLVAYAGTYGGGLAYELTNTGIIRLYLWRSKNTNRNRMVRPQQR